VTYRMHPEICRVISEIAYEGRLESAPACAVQRLEEGEPLGGTGIRWLPVEHSGNRSWSREEIEVVARESGRLIGRAWTDHEGRTRPLRPEDILVVAPYNAQVARLSERVPAGVRVGTVDKFQGQEAPVVFYSMATSSADDLPRQMEFLYSLNRLNVAMSRAQGLAVLVCSPAVMLVRCRTVGQLRLAGGFSRMADAGRAADVALSGCGTESVRQHQLAGDSFRVTPT
jgi:superfamily I DNA and/or RNA helicase